MREIDMLPFNSGNLRWKEAEYFLSQYIKHCGPPIDSHFLMVSYFDAFLYALISIEALVCASLRDELHNKNVFLFLKALRNTSAHHIILGIGLDDSKFSSPVARVINIGSVGAGKQPNDSSQLSLRFDQLRDIFNKIEIEVGKREKRTLDGARQFMIDMESQNRESEYIESFMDDGLKEVQSLLGSAS